MNTDFQQNSTASTIPVHACEDLAGGIANAGNPIGTHDSRPSFFPCIIYAHTNGRLGFDPKMPADATELAAARRQGEFEHLLRIITRTANRTPSGEYYVPGATECTRQSMRNDLIALYAAKLYRETHS